MPLLAKLFHKTAQSPRKAVQQASVEVIDLDPRVSVHYGIPPTASILAFDPIQRLLAVGTLDGRIKVIGGDNIEGFLSSAKALPFKNLEFLENQGFLASVSNDNEVQVWDLEHRRVVSNLQWESNITAFSVIFGTHYMYIGDEYGFLSVLKYDAEKGKIIQLPYYLPADLITETARVSLPNHTSVVGVLPQPWSGGNRLVIAYENGLIILWDVTSDQAVLVRGYKDLQLKDDKPVGSPHNAKVEQFTNTSDSEEAEKDISSLCWVSSDGSILAVGYVDGDILLWNLSDDISSKDKQVQKASNNVVKLQLSSCDRRLPVIVLHWSGNKSHAEGGGKLFVYGGDEIGSEEVLTILSLDWSGGLESLKCIGRVDVTLNGSFADMILVQNAGATKRTESSAFFILSNPGQLHFYDDSCLPPLMSQPKKKHSVPAVQYPEVIPTVEPYMTVGKLKFVQKQGIFSRARSEIVSEAKHCLPSSMTALGNKWPLTGGVPSQLSFDENNDIRRIYIGGYQDGSVRVWDATFPVLSLIVVLGSELEAIGVDGTNAAVSALEFLSSTSSLAVGNECGLVRLYRLIGNTDQRDLHVVTETKQEVHNVHAENGNPCTAVFSVLNSPVRSMQFANSGDRLVVGFECGRVVMLDVSSSSILYCTDSLTSSSSPPISLAIKTFPRPENFQEPSENKITQEIEKEVFLVLTTDGHTFVMDSTTGNMISSLLTHKVESTALSLYILEGSENSSFISSEGLEGEADVANTNSRHEHGSNKTKSDSSAEATYLDQDSADSLVLLCSENALILYSLKTMIKGEGKSIRRVNLEYSCCWTTIFKKDGKTCGLILVYQTGLIEIRSLPELSLAGQCSLTSILRWNFKASMSKTISSSDTGQIVLVNAREIAFVSLFSSENDFRIPEALPSLHDKVLEAAAEAAISVSQTQKKPDSPPGLFGGIIKGIKGVKVENSGDLVEGHTNIELHLEGIFSRFPFSDPFASITDDLDAIELDIDDIKIDEPVPVPSSSQKTKIETKDKATERDKLFEGGTSDSKPRMRTAEEIKAKYRKTGDASEAALQARDKLAERGEKLEKLSERTAELQNGAENFADMASLLAKQMEKRKWWNI